MFELSIIGSEEMKRICARSQNTKKLWIDSNKYNPFIKGLILSWILFIFNNKQSWDIWNGISDVIQT